MNNQVLRSFAVHDARSDAHLCARDRRVLARLLGQSVESRADSKAGTRPAARDPKTAAAA